MVLNIVLWILLNVLKILLLEILLYIMVKDSDKLGYFVK